jgi:bifunctional UDP-N-acetylglucosamine pyrophosphorylase/glucosamine-1-phosphate N-acetyltransferase
MTQQRAARPLASVILAAGQGTRMRSALPKMLHPLGGRPLVRYALASAEAVLAQHGGGRPVLVVGHGQDALRAALGDRVEYAVQEPQLGTGHALAQAAPLVQAAGASAVLVTYGDMPLVEPATLAALVAAFEAHDSPLVLVTAELDDPRGFGRIVRAPDGGVAAIVEEAQATPEQRRIRELNAGIYLFGAAWLWPRLARLPLSPKGEYYLTDLVALAVAEGAHVQAVAAGSPEQFIGVNTRAHLAEAEAALRRRINRRHLEAGVAMLDPASTYVEADVTIGADTVLLPGTHLVGRTRVGSGCVLGPQTYVQDSVIGDGCRVRYAVLEEATLDDEVDVGPFAHLRTGAHLERGVHMGNFGEVKNSTLGPGAKMGHFSYVGDATVGADVNIGAGTITCNFDGVRKHRTVIEPGAFIGSDTMLVAPVTIGAGAKTGAGSVVTRDVPPGAVAYGVPARVRGQEDEGAAGEPSAAETASAGTAPGGTEPDG